MSVASVLEREVKTTDKNSVATSAQNARMQEDELHNAQIKENFARILNPEFKREQINEIKPAGYSEVGMAATQTASPIFTPASEPVYAPLAPQTAPTYEAKQNVFNSSANVLAPTPVAKPYTSARADSAIFRADSDINRVVYTDDISTPVDDIKRDSEIDEEDEDLMPTATTRQYKTQQTAKESQQASKGFSLTKKEKIMIGCFISLVVLLFTVIIINSAIISGMNESVAKLQNTYETVQDTYQTVQQDLKEAQKAENVLAKADEYKISYTTNP
jgi:cell division protein FtsL